MQYRVVPAPEFVQASGKAALQKAATAYEAIIQNNASQGWTFHSMDSTVVQGKCCFVLPTAPVQMKILIFSRP